MINKLRLVLRILTTRKAVLAIIMTNEQGKADIAFLGTATSSDMLTVSTGAVNSAYEMVKFHTKGMVDKGHAREAQEVVVAFKNNVRRFSL